MSTDSHAEIPSLVLKHMDLFACPACGESLRAVGQQGLECSAQQHLFPIQNGIPLLFWPNEWDQSKHDVTQVVRSFYEKNPFPNYDELDSIASLREKANKRVFARWLDDQLRHGARILEVGCGTGQLSNFLGTTWGRIVFGTDLSLNSLMLGEQFRKQNQIASVGFLQMNLFRPAFRQKAFDLVICNGVLHHTSNPFMGFQSISRLVKRGGFVIIGLYNKYGRIPTHLRRATFKLSGDRFRVLDPRLRERGLGELRKQIWFMDQYRNPHESTHTIREVLEWLDRTGFEFTNGIPKPTFLAPLSMNEDLFKYNRKGSRLDHFLVQLGMLLGGGKEGGFFITIGRKVGGD